MGRAPSSLILTGMLFGMFPLQSLLVVVVGEEEGVAGALEEEGGEVLDDSAELLFFLGHQLLGQIVIYCTGASFTLFLFISFPLLLAEIIRSYPKL